MATTNGDIMLSRTDALPDNLEPQSRDDCSSDSNSSICIPRSSSPPRPARVGLPDHLNLDNKAAPAAEPPLGTMTSGPLARKLNSKERRKEQRRKQQRKEERQRRADAADIAAALATASKRQCVRPNEGPKLHPIVLNFAGIMAKLSGVPHYPPPAGPFYTASDQLVGVLRKLIHTWDIDCALCRLHYKAPDTTTHRLENCDCLDESSDARCWLTMFKSYHASCNGKGSRCSECLFPSTLCLRTVYREDMDEEYGHEKEARENWGVIYMEAQCDWVKVIQRKQLCKMCVRGVATGLVRKVRAIQAELEAAVVEIPQPLLAFFLMAETSALTPASILSVGRNVALPALPLPEMSRANIQATLALLAEKTKFVMMIVWARSLHGVEMAPVQILWAAMLSSVDASCFAACS
ncbi:hypothetical protein HYQ46_005216 [Verticillium longisporum]|nr:hypothetical protein HYQ46_005216 [Verticillium longisporum]